ncbi:MAG: TIGR02147 family protein [Sandaracinaceae bacterium]|nr:TIGR02147 family protein [Sandaracinaceae bacterium]
MSDTPPEVFRYLDYRAYLRDFYEHKKAGPRSFSYRAFSRRAGLKSPNYLKLVMDGDRNLTASMAGNFADGCGLSGESKAYFIDLVAFNQAHTGPERTAAYDRLKSHRRYRSVQRLELAHAAYHASWYIPAIRELACRPDFEGEAAWVAARLRPRITQSQAARGLRILRELSMLIQNDDGHWVQAEALVSTGPETAGVHIGNYHRMMMRQAAAAIDEFPPAQRDISSLTLCLGAEKLAEVKARIVRFRRELLELSVEDESPRQVVQVNFQLFPLSDSVELNAGDREGH